MRERERERERFQLREREREREREIASMSQFSDTLVREPLLKGRLSTVNLLTLLLAFKLKKQAALMRRSTVLILFTSFSGPCYGY